MLNLGLDLFNYDFKIYFINPFILISLFKEKNDLKLHMKRFFFSIEMAFFRIHLLQGQYKNTIIELYLKLNSMATDSPLKN